MLLALDTATTTASIALYDLENRQLLSEQTWEARRRQTQDLMGAVQMMLQQQNITPQQLSALAVTTGPGSFTGVRIGISTVKGIGLGLPTIPRIIGIPTLMATADPWLRLAATCEPKPIICSALQAGRGRYNWLMLTAEMLFARPTAQEHQAGTEEELITFLNEQDGQIIWLVGEIRTELEEVLASVDHVTIVPPVAGLRRASQLTYLAAQHLANGTEDSLAGLQPLYLRPPS